MRVRARIPALLGLAVAASLVHTALADVTGTTGGNAPQSTIQPSLGINYAIRTQGTFPVDTGPVIGALGEIVMFAGPTAPQSFALAQGQLLPINQNTALFSLLGFTYGGNGTSTFALPDLRGRTPIDVGQGTGLANYTLGQQVGSESVSLNINNLPSHNHTLPGGGSTSSTGANLPYNNIQPSTAINYVMSLTGIFPAQGPGGPAGVSDSPFMGFIYTTAVNSPPTTNGWVTPSGQIFAINTHQALFSLLGFTYGGNGTSTFALPDLRGRTPLGVGANHPLGESTGLESVSLNASQLPSHDHTTPSIGGVTGLTGGNQSQTSMQPSLALHYVIATDGIFPSAAGTGVEPFLGEISLFAGTFAPSGYEFCDGQLLPVAGNTNLFNIIGTTYGGDGVNTFALPNLDGSLALGWGQGPGLSNWDLGQLLGTETNTLTEAQMPAHDHTFTPVPEPACLCVLAVAALALLTRRRSA